MRLIDADALIAQLKCDTKDCDKCPANDYWFGCGKVKEFIGNAPTIDVVSVVRCKDCKWSIKDDWICGHPNNNAWNISTKHYCGYGERKDDDD